MASLLVSPATPLARPKVAAREVAEEQSGVLARLSIGGTKLVLQTA